MGFIEFMIGSPEKKRKGSNVKETDKHTMSKDRRMGPKPREQTDLEKENAELRSKLKERGE